MTQIQNAEFKKPLTTQTGADTGIAQNDGRKITDQSVFTAQKTANATSPKASSTGAKRPINSKATTPAPQGSVAWAAVKGFFSGAKEGLDEYLAEKKQVQFRKYNPELSFIENVSEHGFWESILDDDTLRTLSIIDDGWEHIKAPIRKWAAQKDQEIFDDDDENLSWKERGWIAAKGIGSMCDELTTGTGICTWGAFAGGGKAVALGWRGGKAVLAAKAAKAAKVAKTTKTATSKGNAITKAAKQYLAEHPKVSNTIRTATATTSALAIPTVPIGLIAFGNEPGVAFGAQMIANAGVPLVGIPLAKGAKTLTKAMIR